MLRRFYSAFFLTLSLIVGELLRPSLLAENCGPSFKSLKHESPSELQPLIDRMREYLDDFKIRGRQFYLAVGEPLTLAQDRELLSAVIAPRLLEVARGHGFSGIPDELFKGKNLKSHYLVSFRFLMPEMLRLFKLSKELTKALRREAAFEVLDADRYRQIQAKGLNIILGLLLSASEKGLLSSSNFDHLKVFEQLAVQLRLDLEKEFPAKDISPEYKSIVSGVSLRDRLLLLGIELARRDLRVNQIRMMNLIGNTDLQSLVSDSIPLVESEVFEAAGSIARKIIERVILSEAKAEDFHFADSAFDALIRTSFVRLGWIQRDKAQSALNLFSSVARFLLLEKMNGESPSQETIQMQLSRFVKLAYRVNKGVEYSDPPGSLNDEEILKISRTQFSSLPKLDEDYKESAVWSLREAQSPVEMLLMDSSIQELLRRLYGRRKEAAKSAGFTPETREAGLLKKQSVEDAGAVRELYQIALTREWIMRGLVRDEASKKTQVRRILDYGVQNLIEIDRMEIQHDRVNEQDRSLLESIYSARAPVVLLMVAVQENLPAANTADVKTKKLLPPKPPSEPKKKILPKAPTPAIQQQNSYKMGLKRLAEFVPEKDEPDREFVVEAALEFLEGLQRTSAYDRDVKSGFLGAIQSADFDWTKLTGVHLQIFKEWLNEFGLQADISKKKIFSQK